MGLWRELQSAARDHVTLLQSSLALNLNRSMRPPLKATQTEPSFPAMRARKCAPFLLSFPEEDKSSSKVLPPLGSGLGSSEAKLRASLKPSLPMYLAALPAQPDGGLCKVLQSVLV